MEVIFPEVSKERFTSSSGKSKAVVFEPSEMDDSLMISPMTFKLRSLLELDALAGASVNSSFW